MVADPHRGYLLEVMLRCNTPCLLLFVTRHGTAWLETGPPCVLALHSKLKYIRASSSSLPSAEDAAPPPVPQDQDPPPQPGAAATDAAVKVDIQIVGLSATLPNLQEVRPALLELRMK